VQSGGSSHRHTGGTAVLTEPQGAGRHRQASMMESRTRVRRNVKLPVIVAAVATAVVIVLSFAVVKVWRPTTSSSQGQWNRVLPTSPDSYIGLYRQPAPASYAGVSSFTAATGVKPSVVVYYSGWMEPFKADFAMTVAEHGEVPLVQIDPTKISLSEIAGGKYDDYLSAYAEAVRAYHRPVILSFGHEMNAYWYSWGNRHTSPTTFVAAWRHIVTLFRRYGADNVTWLWVVNVIQRHRIPAPGPWWPGRSYVTWVGIDGYYSTPSVTFAPLFGPTVAAVRTLTHAPILISETAVAPAAGQPTKIADLFAGIRLYGLLGFVWFDTATAEDWRLLSPAAVAAFRAGAKSYRLRRS
jgi:mannan endo-1,4-beta-mannosidase